MKQKAKIKFVQKNRTNFAAELRKRVDAYFTDNQLSKHANAGMITKTVVMLLLYILPIVGLMVFHQSTWQLTFSYALAGFAMAGIGMNVMHDANHHAYSSNPLVNKLAGSSLNLVGGIVFNWKMQHNILHHTYTNVYEMDDDIDDKLLFRLSPHSRLKKFHRFQHIYIFFFYAIMSLYWVTLKDIVQFIKYRKNGVNRSSQREYTKNAFILAFVKVFYFAYIIFIPVYYFGYTFGQVLFGFVVLHMVCGIILSVIFQLAHSVEEASHPVQNNQNEIENDWAIHQLQTTVNFARKNRLITWYLGGLNYQVEHHLFPTICHVHYPAIAEIVKETAKEYGIAYLEAPTFGAALRSHIQQLKALGSGSIPELQAA